MPEQYKGHGAVWLTCAVCESPFPVRPCRATTAQFCGKPCAAKRQKGMAPRHGESSRKTITPEYQAWNEAKRRCLNKTTAAYPEYGGRGITICDAWRDSYETFLADMGRRPTADHSLDRIDVNGNYEPSNCRWASRAEQQRNKRDNRLISLDGVTRCLTEWSELTGISIQTLWCRMDRGWSDERTINTPVRPMRPRHS